MSGDLKPPKPGDIAPPPEDGSYTIVEIDHEAGQVLVEWEARGLKFRGWTSIDGFERVTSQ